MKKVIVPIVPTNQCRDTYYKKMEEDAPSEEKTKIDLDSNICAGGTEGTQHFSLISFTYSKVYWDITPEYQSYEYSYTFYK